MIKLGLTIGIGGPASAPAPVYVPPPPDPDPVDTTPPVDGALSSTAVTQVSLTLNWTAASDNVGVTGYRVYQDGSLIDTTTLLTYNVSGLTADTAYTFRVTAVDAAGNESSGASHTVTTQAVVVEPPAGWFTDSFDGPALKPEWAVTDGSFTVNGRLRATGTQYNNVFIDRGVRDTTIRANLYASTSIDSVAMLLFRGRPATYQYLFIEINAVAQKLNLAMRDGGIAPLTNVDITYVDGAEVKVVLSGQNIKVYYNGASSPTLDYTTPWHDNPDATRVGCGTWANDSSIDNFVVD